MSNRLDQQYRLTAATPEIDTYTAFLAMLRDHYTNVSNDLPEGVDDSLATRRALGAILTQAIDTLNNRRHNLKYTPSPQREDYE